MLSHPEILDLFCRERLPELVQLIYRLQRGEKCFLVTDAAHAPGLVPGRYSFAGTDIALLETGKK